MTYHQLWETWKILRGRGVLTDVLDEEPVFFSE